MMVMAIISESSVTTEVDLEDESDEQEQESALRTDDQSCLNCASLGQTVPDREPLMTNVSSLQPKKQQFAMTEDVEPEGEDEKMLSSDSPSRHEQQQLLQFFYWDTIKWVEFPLKMNAVLGAALKRNCETVVLPVAENRLYKIDFKNKLQMNLKTGYFRSLTWECSSTGSIKFAGFDKPFDRQQLLPSDDCLMMSGSHKQQQQQHDIKSVIVPSPPPPPRPPSHLNRRADTAAEMLLTASCPFQSRAVETFAKLGDRIAVLQPGNKEFNAVNHVFNRGFSSRPSLYGKLPRLTAVHKVINNEAKLRYFREQLQSMERLRGKANLRHTWHGTSADAIISIVMYGFGQRPMSLNGNNFGCGTYVAPCSKLDVSAQYAEVDENMEQHVLLCEVVLGESEVIAPGSCHRFLPSSTSYDSGVDDLDNPNLHIIWTPFINSHIIPWYIVSFATEEATQKLSGPLRRLPEIMRPSPYFSSPRQPPTLEPKDVNDLLHPSGLRTCSKSEELELPARATAALPAVATLCRENKHNHVVEEGCDSCVVKAQSASKESLEESAPRRIQAVKTSYRCNNISKLAGSIPKDDKSSIPVMINLSLGLNSDGFSHQTKHSRWLAQSLRHQ